jgi:bla regulator protein BlaR1
MNGIFVAIGALALTFNARSQPASPSAFEVASIRPHPEPVTVSGESVSGTRATWTADTLLNLISGAYGLKYAEQIAGGPRWAASDRFDIVAKANGEGTLSKEQVAEMLQTLLADRFQLRIHREMKEMPVYALVVARGGPKVKPPDLSKTGMRTMAGATGIHITAWQGSMEKLADQLSVTAERPVLDKTGLLGDYAFTLAFTPLTGAVDSDIPSMSTALEEQLGLRLEPQRAPLEIIVIDNAERPSPN